jgi:hypothetical protein
MPAPGFDVPSLASYPPAGNLYYEADVHLAAPAQQVAYPTHPAQAMDLTPPPLMFASPMTPMTARGEEAVSAAKSTKGHWSEILNFHGSPAPWILIGILLVAGLLQISASGRFGFGRE